MRAGADEEINANVMSFVEWAKDASVSYKVSWVASAANPADPPSRARVTGVVERVAALYDDENNLRNVVD